MAHHQIKMLYRGIAQLVEQRSPKPRAEGSSPSAPAKETSTAVAVLVSFCTVLIIEHSAGGACRGARW